MKLIFVSKRVISVFVFQATMMMEQVKIVSHVIIHGKILKKYYFFSKTCYNGTENNCLSCVEENSLRTFNEL